MKMFFLLALAALCAPITSINAQATAVTTTTVAVQNGGLPPAGEYYRVFSSYPKEEGVTVILLRNQPGDRVAIVYDTAKDRNDPKKWVTGRWLVWQATEYLQSGIRDRIAIAGDKDIPTQIVRGFIYMTMTSPEPDPSVIPVRRMVRPEITLSTSASL